MARNRETFGTHANTAHAWAQGTYGYGRSGDGRIFFRDGAIYSHGFHFTIAQILPRTFHGRRVVLWNSETYSVSTSSHQGHARGALRGTQDLIVPIVNLGSTSAPQQRESWESLVATLAYMIDSREKRAKDRATALVSAQEYARKHDTADGYWQRQADELAAPDTGEDNARLALAAFRWHYKTKWVVPADPVAHVLRRKTEANRKAHAASIALAKRTLTRFADWSLAAATEGKDSMQIHYMSRDLERNLTAVRSARLKLSKTKRFPRLVREASRIIKALSAAREPLLVRFNELQQEESHGRVVALYEGVRDGAAVSRYDAQCSLAGDAWAYALQVGDNATAARFAEAVHAFRYAEEFDSYHPRPYTRHRVPSVTPDAWREGQGNASQSFGSTLVRRKGDMLETSRGAVVAWRDAKRVFFFAQAKRRDGESWRRNGEHFRVGIYQLDSIDATGNVQAGCHTIPWHEMESCAVREFDPHELPATFPVPALTEGVSLCRK